MKKLKGLKKRCACAKASWDRCDHPWFFTFQFKGRVERGSLGESEREKAVTKLTEIKAGMMNGTYIRVQQAPTPLPASTRATFQMVADEYAKDVEGLAKLAAASQRQHGYAITFLAGVVVPPGLPVTDKPFADIIRADIKTAIRAKETPAEKTHSNGQRTWTRTVGGKVAANRLHDHLRSLWNWAIEQGYATASPFLRTRKGKNRLKHAEFSRDRRLREGEDAALLAHANPLLKDVIVAALETGMRKGELLSLVWRQVRWLQKDLYLPGGKTKARRDRKIPISPALREILTRRQYGMTLGPNPQEFKYGAEHYVFGNEAGQQIKDVKTAWENTVLKAHGTKPERARGGRLSAECRAKLAEIDLHEHDLRHEAGSRKLEAGWPLHAVSAFLGHANITTTARYLNVKDDYLQELTERQPLTLVRG